MGASRHTSKPAAVAIVKVLVTARESLTLTQIAVAAGTSYGNVKNWIRYLIAGGLVEFAGTSTTGSGIKPVLYRWRKHDGT